MKKGFSLLLTIFFIFLFYSNTYATDKQKCFLTDSYCNISDGMAKSAFKINSETKKEYDNYLNNLYIEETQVLIGNIKENDIKTLSGVIKKSYNSKMNMYNAIIKGKDMSKIDIAKFQYFSNNIKIEIKKIDAIIKSIEEYNKNLKNSNNKSEIEYIKIIENKNIYNVFSLKKESFDINLGKLNNLYGKNIGFLNKYNYNDLMNDCINEVNSNNKSIKCSHIEKFNPRYIYNYKEKIRLGKSILLNEYLTWFIKNNYGENSNSEINIALKLSAKSFVDVKTNGKDDLIKKINKFNNKDIITDTIKKKINEKSIQEEVLFNALYKGLYTNIDNILIGEIKSVDNFLQRKTIIPKSNFDLKNESLKNINNWMIEKDSESSLISNLKDANQGEMFDIYREFISQTSSMKSLPGMNKNPFIITTVIIDNYYKKIDRLSIISYLNDALNNLNAKLKYNKDLAKVFFDIQ